MAILDYVEFVLAKLLSSVRGHEDARLVKSAPFASLPTPNIEVSSPLGPSGTDLPVSHTQVGENTFPDLAWSSTLPDVKEYVLICEDVDAPMPAPINHGFYYGIPAEKTALTNADFEKAEVQTSKGANGLKGGFFYGANLRGTIYNGPRALKGHGPHRYYYQVVALKEKLDFSAASPVPKKDELLKAMDGKVVGWGEWVGVSERKF